MEASCELVTASLVILLVPAWRRGVRPRGTSGRAPDVPRRRRPRRRRRRRPHASGGKPVTDLKAERLSAARHRPAAAHPGVPNGADAGQRRPARGLQRQHGRRREARRPRATTRSICSSWLTPGVDQAGLFVFDKQLREAAAARAGAGRHPRAARRASRVRSARRRSSTRSPRPAACSPTDGRPASRGRRADRRRATTQPADAGRGLRRSRAASTCPSTSSSSSRRSIASGTTTVDERATLDDALAAARSATWRAGPAARSSPASARRSRAWPAQQIVDELRQQYLIAFEPDQPAGLAPDRGAHARQGSRRAHAERVRRAGRAGGAVSKCRYSRRFIMRKSLVAQWPCRVRRRRIDGVRDQGIREERRSARSAARSTR